MPNFCPCSRCFFFAPFTASFHAREIALFRTLAITSSLDLRAQTPMFPGPFGSVPSTLPPFVSSSSATNLAHENDFFRGTNPSSCDRKRLRPHPSVVVRGAMIARRKNSLARNLPARWAGLQPMRERRTRRNEPNRKLADLASRTPASARFAFQPQEKSPGRAAVVSISKNSRNRWIEQRLWST